MELQITNSVSSVLFDIWKEVEKESVLQVSGGSMWPLMGHGDKVLIKHSLTGIEPGSLIAFRQNNRIVVHRVLRSYSVRGETVYICRGDHNRHLDRRVQESEIVGKVISIERNDKRTINVASSYWQIIGKLIVQSVNFSRALPGEIGRHRFFRFLGLAVLRSVSFV